MVEERELFTKHVPTDEERVEVDTALVRATAKALSNTAEQELASNLTLIMPPRIQVDFVEWDEGTGEQGEKTLNPRVRRASISTYVPMMIFHQMLAGRVEVLQLKQSDTQNPEHTAKMMDWMQEMTFEVWKLSEPNMSKARFGKGLQMDQIMELFQRFFGALMTRMGERGKFMQALHNS